MAEMTIEGISAMESRLRDIDRSIRDSLSSTLLSEAEQMAERARNEFVPVRDGELRDSIRVEKARVEQGRTETGQFTDGADIVVRVVAGGEGIDHAVAVHETPSEYDPPTWQGKEVEFRQGGPKYLEKPLFEMENGLLERLGQGVKLE